MRQASVACVDFLASRLPCAKADLFTFTYLSGLVERWTTFSSSIPYGGQTWRSGGPLVSRTGLGVRNSLEIPEMNLKLVAPQSYLLNGLPIRQRIIDGYFDGCLIEMDRIFMPSRGDFSLGLVLMFLGRKSTVKTKGDVITLTVKGGNVLLNQNAPKNTYQTSCLHTFCDAGCTLLEASFTTTNTVGLGSTDTNVVWGSIPGTPSVYTLGKITMTSGASSGQVRAIRSATNAGIVPSYPFSYGVSPGDTFSVVEGCDKTRTRCTALSNIQHYRGFPYVPPVEMSA